MLVIDKSWNPFSKSKKCKKARAVIKRSRQFLCGLCLVCALTLIRVGVAQEKSAAPTDRPNFLFIYTDDQRWDALGVVQREQGDKARFPWFQTPNLDRLA